MVSTNDNVAVKKLTRDCNLKEDNNLNFYSKYNHYLTFLNGQLTTVP